MKNSGDLPLPFKIHDRSILLVPQEAQSIYNKLTDEPITGKRLYPLAGLLNEGLTKDPDSHVPIDISHGLLLTRYYATKSTQAEDDRQRLFDQRCAHTLMIVCVYHRVLPSET